MPIYVAQIPSNVAVDDDTAQAVTEWLTARGYAVEGVAVRPADGVVVVNADRDPSADLAAYDGTASQERRRVQQLVQNVTTYAQAVEAGGAPTQAHLTAAQGFVAAMTAGTAPTAAQTQAALWVSMSALRGIIRLVQVAYREFGG